MASLNKVTIIGNLGKDPEIRSFKSGDKVAEFSVATSESWNDKATGEKKEKTEWHNVSVTNQGIVKVIESYVKKGSKVYIEGKLETQEYEKDGVKRYTTKIVLKPYNGTLILLDGRSGDSEQTAPRTQEKAQAAAPVYNDGFDDDIPF